MYDVFSTVSVCISYGFNVMIRSFQTEKKLGREKHEHSSTRRKKTDSSRHHLFLSACHEKTKVLTNFWLIDFSLFSHTNTNTNSPMLQKNAAGTQGSALMDGVGSQGGIEAKKEMAGRLLVGDGVDKDDARAVLLLEDCVARGDADAMLMLAICCAFGRGMEHNAERAEALVLEAAMKGNDEARILMELINDWKEKRFIYFSL